MYMEEVQGILNKVGGYLKIVGVETGIEKSPTGSTATISPKSQTWTSAASSKRVTSCLTTTTHLT